MNLPVVLDIGIGLIFIYLILSLLASEVQELLSTILQWRAEHLKKSIEILLAGGSKTPEEERAIELANSLYNNSLIKNLNQEAKGLFVSLPRRITWLISSIYRGWRNKIPLSRRNHGIFGQQKRSGPSYIDSQTFATTLLETLRIPTLSHHISTSKLKEFKDERLVKELQNILDEFKDKINNIDNLHPESSEDNSTENLALDREIERDFETLKKQFEKIFKDFENGKATLTTSLDRIEEKLDIYITNIQENLALKNESLGKSLFRKLNSLKIDIFGSNSNSNRSEKVALLGELKPSLTELIQNYKENYNIYLEARKQIEDAIRNNNYIDLDVEYKCQNLENLFGKIESDRHILPQSVLDSLEVLAIRAQAKVKSTEDDLNQLRQEIEIWFDRSMERASGVYKRNAKGVAILIGCSLAIAANADTLYIIDRLSTDTILRSTIVESASNVAKTPNDIKTVRKNAETELKNIALPIGWNLPNSPNNKSSNWFWQAAKKLCGWVLTGMAISMGAPFWFDLLGRVVNVRNAGKPPKSTVNSETVSDN